jgi:cell division protein WhiA
MSGMSLTALVKDELSRLPVTKPCCRKAEVSTTLRFAGGLRVLDGRIVVEALLDTGEAARRLCRQIGEMIRPIPEVIRLASGDPGQASRYLVRVVRDGDSLARQSGLLDAWGRPMRGLSPRVVAGATCDGEAAWRGAFLAHGCLPVPGRSCALEVTCPGPEAALALVGAARRIGVVSRTRQVHGVDRVVIRDGDMIVTMLTRLGAPEAVRAWQEHRARRPARGIGPLPATFDEANLRRSARAAVSAAVRVERALDILGEVAPEHLRAAGRLRLAHERVSLEELARFADPPMTKDAVAGRIRRLLAMADKRAGELGVPGTDADLAPDLLDA